MKTKVFTIVSVFFVAIIVIWSCSKKDDNKYTSDGSKKNVFPSGQQNDNFANGGSNNIFSGNGGGNIQGGEDCAVGTWTTPKDSWSSCPQDFHLKLTFNAGGTGESWHVDPYLCNINMHKMFTWKQKNDSIFIKFDDGDESKSKFVCPANQMVIYWNFGNFKLLTRQ
jgi:hypothetical protein